MEKSVSENWCKLSRDLKKVLVKYGVEEKFLVDILNDVGSHIIPDLDETRSPKEDLLSPFM